MDKFGHQSGLYVLSVLAGDLTYSSALEFIAGSLTLDFPGPVTPSLPLYAQSLLHASDTALKPLQVT